MECWINVCKPENSSYETRNFSSNISSNMRKKCWMKFFDWFAPALTRKFCWLSLKMLNEKFGHNQVFIQHDFSSSSMIFSFLLFLCSVKPVQHFIQHGIFLCWMKCWIGLTRPLENSSTFTGKNMCQILSLNKVASFQPDTLLKETPPQLFS